MVILEGTSIRKKKALPKQYSKNKTQSADNHQITDRGARQLIAPDELVGQEVCGCSAEQVDTSKQTLPSHNRQYRHKQIRYSKKTAAGQKQHFCSEGQQIIMVQ